MLHIQFSMVCCTVGIEKYTQTCLFLKDSVNGVPATSLGKLSLPLFGNISRDLCSFPLLGCLSLALLKTARWFIYGKSFPSRRFHSSFYDCQQSCMRSGVSSHAPRPPLSHMYSLSATFFTCELQGQAAAPANHCCSTPKAKLLYRLHTCVVFLVFF